MLSAQASVYLARSGKGAGSKRVKAKHVHAPARRLARTIISLGQDEGVTFGVRAIRQASCNTILSPSTECVIMCLSQSKGVS